MSMKPELYVHLIHQITESERRAQHHSNLLLREVYARHAKMLRQTLAHYEEVGDDPALEKAIAQLKMEPERG